MASELLTIRTLQAVGLTSAAACTGYSLALSTAVVPRLLESPSPLLLRQWLHMYNSGMRSVLPSVAFTSSIFGFLSYSSYKMEAHRHVLYGYLGATILPLLIIPYTRIVLMPTNFKLMAKEEDTRDLAVTDKVSEEGLGDETAHALVDKWGMINLGRAVLLGVGALVGSFTSLMHPL